MAVSIRYRWDGAEPSQKRIDFAPFLPSQPWWTGTRAFFFGLNKACSMQRFPALPFTLVTIAHRNPETQGYGLEQAIFWCVPLSFWLPGNEHEQGEGVARCLLIEQEFTLHSSSSPHTIAPRQPETGGDSSGLSQWICLLLCSILGCPSLLLVVVGGWEGNLGHRECPFALPFYSCHQQCFLARWGLCFLISSSITNRNLKAFTLPF